MKNPLISVVIPNYNHAQFLEKRIESVLNQTYKNIEIILLDDKSTDNSIDIIKKYEQNPVVSHVLQNTENSGSPFLQ
jgi:glycosyltransferase involved in cell wall biosynthesis